MRDPHATSQRGGPGGLSLLAHFARVLEASVVVFTRCRFGERFLGGYALFVIPTVLLFAQANPSSDPDDVMAFIVVWFVAFICHRADIAFRKHRGDVEHSYYNGFPILGKLPGFRRSGERHIKAAAEPLLIFLAGAVLLHRCEAIGVLLMWGAAGTMLSALVSQAQESRRITDIRDTQIEQRNLAEHFREDRWRR